MITPVLFYRDPMAAIRFLEAAFGFEVAMLLTDDQGRIGHSELNYDGAAISVGWGMAEFGEALLGPARMRSPASLDSAGTQFLRIAVAEPIDEHCERARAAGARITQAPEDQFYGDRTYRALDPEGHVWNFSQKVRDVSLTEMQAASGLTGLGTSLGTPEEANHLETELKRPTLSTGVYYRDPKAALKWLEAAFGFEATMVVLDPEGNLAHSELRLGDGMIMIGGEYDERHKSPASVGGGNTQGVHVQLLDDGIDAHYERACKAGAIIAARTGRLSSTATGPIWRADPEGTSIGLVLCGRRSA